MTAPVTQPNTRRHTNTLSTHNAVDVVLSTPHSVTVMDCATSAPAFDILLFENSLLFMPYPIRTILVRCLSLRNNWMAIASAKESIATRSHVSSDAQVTRTVPAKQSDTMQSQMRPSLLMRAGKASSSHVDCPPSTVRRHCHRATTLFRRSECRWLAVALCVTAPGFIRYRSHWYGLIYSSQSPEDNRQWAWRCGRFADGGMSAWPQCRRRQANSHIAAEHERIRETNRKCYNKVWTSVFAVWFRRLSNVAGPMVCGDKTCMACVTVENDTSVFDVITKLSSGVCVGE